MVEINNAKKIKGHKKELKIISKQDKIKYFLDEEKGDYFVHSSQFHSSRIS